MKLTRKQLQYLIMEAIGDELGLDDIIPGDGELNDAEAEMLQKLSSDAAAEEINEPDKKLMQFTHKIESDVKKLVSDLQRFTGSAKGNPSGTGIEKVLFYLSVEFPKIIMDIKSNNITNSTRQKLMGILSQIKIVRSPRFNRIDQGITHLYSKIKHL